MSFVKKYIKNERGLTLIELLAVVVILGIIAAIAIPSIGKLMENSKKDAHIANAQQMANSARLYITEKRTTVNSTGVDIKLSDLITNGFIDSIKDPSDKTNTYDETNSKVTVKEESGKINYYVTLKSNGGNNAVTYIDGTVKATDLDRDNVDLE
ncbi:type II secretion system protein [Peribacillus tepidiphilus]|uniref:type II secretion system protein n=1 Tax=Peribacillus tepidiphilus TaxID=2652445 RepID=UPI0012916A80|nr:type II secretion system protein [Peribacillus tepidiphilus]